MTLFQSARGLFATLLMVTLVAGLAACGGTGGESDTDAPFLTMEKVPVSTIERARVLSGSVEPGAQLEISRNSVVVNNPVPDANGIWSYTIDLVPGVNTIAVKATDATGNNTTLVFPLTYDVFTLDVELPSTSVQGQTLRGTVANGGSFSGTLTISGSTTVVQNIPTITTANWTHTLETLDPGTYTLTLTGTDDIAQPTRTQNLTRTLVFDPDLPSLTVNPASEVGATVVVDGTVAIDAAISEVLLNGVAIDLATVTQAAGSGTWSVTLSNLKAGRHQLDITAKRAAEEKQATARLWVLYQPQP